MLMPKQFIPGAGNGKANAFSWGTFENHTYLVSLKMQIGGGGMKTIAKHIFD